MEQTESRESKMLSGVRKIQDRFLYQALICVVSMVIIGVLYFCGLGLIKNHRDINRASISDITLITEIDIRQNENSITGWVYKKDASINEVRVILKNVEAQEAHICKSLKVNSPEEYNLDEEIKDKANLFQVRIDENQVVNSNCYEIILAISFENTNGKKNVSYTTGRYLYQEKLYACNPLDFIEPRFNDEYMQQVVENGELKVASKEMDISIYEYDKKLYYIAGEEFAFADVGKTHIVCHVYSYADAYLPENRREYGYDNLDFRFEDKEIKFGINEAYRMACIELPITYPVFNIRFAVYDDIAKNMSEEFYFR